MKCFKGDGAPSFCWQCNRQLYRAPGKGLGLFYYALVVDRDGKEHRVHGDCVPEATQDPGVKQLKNHR